MPDKTVVERSTHKQLYHLEDAEFSIESVKERIEKSFRFVDVRSYTTRRALEKVWLNQPKPAAVIVDLLVPDKWVWFVRILLGRPRRLYKRLTYFVLRKPARAIAAKIAPRYITELDKSLEKLKLGLVDDRDTHWGGVEFLRSRVLKEDHEGIPFYVYSMAANEDMIQHDTVFGPICQRIKQYVESYRDKFGLNIVICAKGYVPGILGISTESGKLKGDELSKLLSALPEVLDSSQDSSVVRDER